MGSCLSKSDAEAGTQSGKKEARAQPAAPASQPQAKSSLARLSVSHAAATPDAAPVRDIAAAAAAPAAAGPASEPAAAAAAAPAPNGDAAHAAAPAPHAAAPAPDTVPATPNALGHAPPSTVPDGMSLTEAVEPVQSEAQRAVLAGQPYLSSKVSAKKSGLPFSHPPSLCVAGPAHPASTRCI